MHLKHVSLGILLTTIPYVAHSEVYMSEEQAAKTLFPTEIFQKKSFELTPEQVKKIEESSEQRVRANSIKTWVSSNKNVVFIDQVLGKHEFITYAVGITNEGKVQGIEILEYRESYGSQIKGEAWRKQFVGLNKAAPLKVGRDINNISGATLSSTHVTAGVKRILQTYDSIRDRV